MGSELSHNLQVCPHPPVAHGESYFTGEKGKTKFKKYYVDLPYSLFWQDLKDQLSFIANERDKMMSQIEEQKTHLAKVEIVKKSYEDRVSSLDIRFPLSETVLWQEFW